jgi:hypothetical protein
MTWPTICARAAEKSRISASGRLWTVVWVFLTYVAGADMECVGVGGGRLI